MIDTENLLLSPSVIILASLALAIGVVGSSVCRLLRDWLEASALGLTVWEFRHGRRRWRQSLGALMERQEAEQSRSHDIPPAFRAEAEPTSAAPKVQKAQRISVHRSPEEHAEELLRRLRRLGWVEPSYSEVEAQYRELCRELEWEIRPWATVARQLRHQLGGQKQYRWRNGRQVRVYTLRPGRALSGEPRELAA